MPFGYILADLVASNPGALAALFVDDTGETVDLACADGSPSDMKVLGAYVGIYLRQVGQYLDPERYGELQLLHVESGGRHLYALPVSDGYFLVLVQRRPAPALSAGRRLAAAGARLSEELFGDG